MTRRKALRGLAGFLAASPLLRGQQDRFRDHSRVPAMEELVDVFDFEAVAYEKLPRQAYDYTGHGTESEFTLRRNREAFDWVKLVPRTVVDVSAIDPTTEILGTKMAFPIMIAPTAAHAQLHPDGEAATHQGGTAASNTLFLMSHNASLPFDKIAASAAGPLWFQLYARETVEENLPVLDTVQTAGYRAVAMTIDQNAAVYERQQHNRHLSAPGGPGGGRGGRGGRGRGRNEPMPNPYRGVNPSRLWYNWAFAEKLRPHIKVPFLAKGVMTAADAKIAVETGFEGIIVSNHGGRAMDQGTSTLEMLPEIVDAVGGRVPVLIDSGFRRGTDVLKALALGAKAVGVGRAVRWGLGSYGAPGAQRVLEILQGELVLAMAHTGRPTLKSIDRTLVKTDFR
jgi:4-hydroxymandelate oxidase